MTMKVKFDHQQQLMYAIYRSMQGMETLAEYKARGFTAKRWRWDLLWQAKRMGYLPERFIEDTIYAYANDNHIDTVLCRVTSTK